jgi:hypothetical protein
LGESQEWHSRSDSPPVPAWLRSQHTSSPVPPPDRPSPPRSVTSQWWFWAATAAVVVLLAGGAYALVSSTIAPSTTVGVIANTSPSETAGETTAVPGLDGTQTYATIAELHAAITADGVTCDDLTETPNPRLALALSVCNLRGENTKIYLHLWRNGDDRDDGTTANVTRLSSLGSNYCFVVGQGEGAWSVNASADPSFCRSLAARLGGRLVEQEAPDPTTSAAPSTTPSAPATTTPPPPPAPTTPAVSAGQENALRTAQDYLDYTAFSRQGLIEQLQYEGYSVEEATWAVDHLTVDWNQQAAAMAREYLDYSSFSRQGLIDQLEYEGFTPEQAEYGVAQEYD